VVFVIYPCKRYFLTPLNPFTNFPQNPNPSYVIPMSLSGATASRFARRHWQVCRKRCKDVGLNLIRKMAIQFYHRKYVLMSLPTYTSPHS
jgi:hypothetical protein